MIGSRTEGLLPHQLHLRRDVGHHRRSKEGASEVIAAPAPGEDAGTSRDGIGDPCLDHLDLRWPRDSAHVGIGFRTLAQRLRHRDHLLDEPLVDGRRDQRSLYGDARLAGVREGAADRRSRRARDVRVVTDDHRVLAAEFHHDGRQGVGGSRHDPATSERTARERHLVHLASNDRLAHSPVAGHDPDEILTSGGDRLAQENPGQRRELGWLDTTALPAPRADAIACIDTTSG